MSTGTKRARDDTNSNVALSRPVIPPSSLVPGLKVALASTSGCSGVKIQGGTVTKRARRLGETSLKVLDLVQQSPDFNDKHLHNMKCEPRISDTLPTPKEDAASEIVGSHAGRSRAVSTLKPLEHSVDGEALYPRIPQYTPVYAPALLFGVSLPAAAPNPSPLAPVPGARAAARERLQAAAAAASAGLLEIPALRELFESVRHVFIAGAGTGRHALPLGILTEALRQASRIKSHASDGKS